MPIWRRFALFILVVKAYWEPGMPLTASVIHLDVGATDLATPLCSMPKAWIYRFKNLYRYLPMGHSDFQVSLLISAPTHCLVK